MGSQTLSISPRAIPAAGGCSVSVATMIKMAIPTDMAPNPAMVKVWDIGRELMIDEVAMRWRAIPTIIPTR